MAYPNTQPIYAKDGNLTASNSTTMTQGMVTATGDYTGASANHVLAFTAGAQGAYLKKIKFVATGTNTATVARIYLNNGSVNTTAANNQLIGQISLPGTTAINTAATTEPEYTLEFAIPASFRIYIGLGTTVAALWVPTVYGGNY